MPALRIRFLSLSPAERRLVHAALVEQALARWKAYALREGPIHYRETVSGTEQLVDPSLPEDAIAAVGSGADAASVEWRYGEPMAALQDRDISFPEPIAFAYYGIHNFFRRYALGEEVDDWLLVNQAASSEEDERRWEGTLRKAIEKAAESAAARRTG